LFFLVISCLKAEVSNQTLALLVNVNDPESMEIAQFYQKVRLIPEENVIYLNFKHTDSMITELEFKKIMKQLDKKVSDDIQAYALAWRKPWRVSCMSITAAFTLGFSREYCAQGCKLTKAVPYFNSQSNSPFTDYNIRPSMMLSAGSVDIVKRLIKRGVSADDERPAGTAYLLNTSDKQRNVRSAYYAIIEKKLSNLLNIEKIDADAIKNANDILFYFTGLERVRWVNDNNYLPGAVADHLTSNGGQLFGSTQMSAIEWIDAGVTGTYGTVIEPCNFLQKFPNPAVLIKKYMSGETLLESYWKSVAGSVCW